jgi:hypothetical protein
MSKSAYVYASIATSSAGSLAWLPTRTGAWLGWRCARVVHVRAAPFGRKELRVLRAFRRATLDRDAETLPEPSELAPGGHDR